MISPNVPYRVGFRALVYMIIRKLKYPVILILCMTLVSLLLHFGNATLVSWQMHAPAFLHGVTPFLYVIQKYGWILAILLTVCLGLTALPEYGGLAVMLGDNAFRVRFGILTYRETTIPYRQIQTVNLEQSVVERMFGVCSMVVSTSAHDNASTESDDADVVLPLVHVSLARQLQEELLKRVNNQ